MNEVTKLSLPNADLLSRWEPELKNHNNQSRKERVVVYEGKLYIVKCGDKKRALLAYLLGEDLVNIAEAKLIREEDLDEIRKLNIPLEDHACVENTFLVRLVQGYSVEELPIKELDAAVAGELVFSIWIRRRDAHAYNRAYIQGVPIFFDHHAAFLFEEALRDIDKFFSTVGPGHAGSWRVKEIVAGEKINTMSMRSNSNWGGLHFIHSSESFKWNTEKFVDKIKSDRRDWKNLAIKAGFEGQELSSAIQFLEASRSTLSNDAKRLLNIVFQSGEVKRNLIVQQKN